MRWIKSKLFTAMMTVVAVVCPREFKRYIRSIQEGADMNGFFDGYRAGHTDGERHVYGVASVIKHLEV